MQIKIIKFKKDIKIPTRAHYDDAGLDCYALEDYELLPLKISSAEFEEIRPNEFIPKDIPNIGTFIPLGFGLDIPSGYMATIRPRSSMNKKGVLTQIGTIDSGYKGEICAILCNLTSEKINIKAGDKICQIVVEPVIIADLVEEYGSKERGESGFGSTGK